MLWYPWQRKGEKMKNDIIRFIPLGGQAEMGKSMYCLEINEKIYIIDSGFRFPDIEIECVNGKNSTRTPFISNEALRLTLIKFIFNFILLCRS